METESCSVQSNNEEQPVTAHKNKTITKKEELQQALLKQAERLKMWQKTFDNWNILQAKEINDICSEIDRAKDETSTFSQQRVIMREEIARLEMASKDLTKKIIESGQLENKLEKKEEQG